MKLREIKNEVDQYFYGQENIKKEILTSICSDVIIQQSNNKHLASRILIGGNSGTGKSFLVEVISNVLDIPCVFVDCSQLSKTGFAGKSVTDVFNLLLVKCKNNLFLAEKSIVFFDEFDKLFNKKTDYSFDISGTGVQYELLKVFDGGTILLDNNGQQIEFHTDKLIIICAGAFSYTDLNALNFEHKQIKKEGFISELVGRLNKVVYMNDYTKEDYIKIIKEGYSKTIQKYKYIFEQLNSNLEFTEDEIVKFAEQAIEIDLGVRGIEIAIERHLSKDLYSLLLKE